MPAPTTPRPVPLPQDPPRQHPDPQQWEWFTGVHDERTCAVCYNLEGTRSSVVRDPAHALCRCVQYRVGSPEWTRACIARELRREQDRRDTIRYNPQDRPRGKRLDRGY